MFAFKHHHQAFSRPRVKFRKAQYVNSLLCLTTLVVSNAVPLRQHDGIQYPASFDTDSLDFGVDNRCSACISNVREHFVGDLQKTSKVIKGYGGSRIHNVWEGTMQLRIADDDGDHAGCGDQTRDGLAVDPRDDDSAGDQHDQRGERPAQEARRRGFGSLSVLLSLFLRFFFLRSLHLTPLQSPLHHLRLFSS